MQPRHKCRLTAFTIIELLVVIAIIALLVSILMPSLKQATYMARQVQCVGNMRVQINALGSYAVDNSGWYPPHRGVWWPDWFCRTASETEAVWPAMTGYVHGAGFSRTAYIDDPTACVCPMLTQLDAYMHDAEGTLGSTYGGWGREDRGVILGPYEWYAGFDTRTSPENQGRCDFQTYGEPPWPLSLRDASAGTAVLSHLIRGTMWGGVYLVDDHSHMGRPRYVGTGLADFLDNIQSRHQPVGFGDGHVEVRSRSQIKPRVIVNNVSTYIY